MQALTNAIVRADKWLAKATPQDILKTVPEAYLLGDKALYLFAYGKIKEALSPDGSISDAGAKATLKALATFDPQIKADRDQTGSDLYQRVREEGERKIQMSLIPDASRRRIDCARWNGGPGALKRLQFALARFIPPIAESA